MVAGTCGIMGGIDGSAVVMLSASLARGSSHDAWSEEGVGRHLKPNRVVVAVAVKHRRSRQRLHGQCQQEEGNSNTPDALSHGKSIALSKSGSYTGIDQPATTAQRVSSTTRFPSAARSSIGRAQVAAIFTWRCCSGPGFSKSVQYAAIPRRFCLSALPAKRLELPCQHVQVSNAGSDMADVLVKTPPLRNRRDRVFRGVTGASRRYRQAPMNGGRCRRGS